jgi:uncharacterized protein (DUF2147 family)
MPGVTFRRRDKQLSRHPGLELDKLFRIILAAFLAFGISAAGATAAPQNPANGTWMQNNPDPTGRWMTANHNAVVEISPCGQDICGRIVGMALNPGDPIPKDWRGKSQCGMTIFRTAPDTPGGSSWTGTILDPRDGDTYHAKITGGKGGQIKLRGYLGLSIFGQTQTWTAYTGKITQDCRLPG